MCIDEGAIPKSHFELWTSDQRTNPKQPEITSWNRKVKPSFAEEVRTNHIQIKRTLSPHLLDPLILRKANRKVNSHRPKIKIDQGSNCKDRLARRLHHQKGSAHFWTWASFEVNLNTAFRSSQKISQNHRWSWRPYPKIAKRDLIDAWNSRIRNRSADVGNVGERIKLEEDVAIKITGNSLTLTTSFKGKQAK